MFLIYHEMENNESGWLETIKTGWICRAWDSILVDNTPTRTSDS